MTTDNKDNELSIWSNDYAEILRHAVAVSRYDEKVQRNVALLPWSHNMLLLSRKIVIAIYRAQLNYIYNGKMFFL